MPRAARARSGPVAAALGSALWSAWASAQPAPPRPLPPAPALPAPPAAPAPPEPAPAGRAPGAPTPAPAPADQGPDTLPSLDEEPSLPEPRPAPRAARRPSPPIRAERRIALSGELGWNGLAGFGAIISYHADPHLSFDLGAGLAIVGGKLGLRARYNFSERHLTPFVGLGIMGATGFDAPTRDLAADEGNAELNLELRPSAFLQGVVGLDWTSRNGFTLIGALGYAWMLTHDNVVIITGEPTEEERRGIDAVFRSGIVISIAIGYSFR